MYNILRDLNAAKTFVKRIHEIYEEVKPLLESYVPMETICNEEKARFNAREDCYLCGKKFDAGEKKHLDHCHYTGKVLGYTHPNCNMDSK